MINKQNLWFVTLFSLIIVLGIYYITMKDESLGILSGGELVSEVSDIKESDVIVALEVEDDESVLKQVNEYQNILLDDTATLEEKNDAYDSLQTINNTKSEVEKITKVIKEKFSLESFAKITNDSISIVIAKKDHNVEMANKIIREVQSLYDNQKYITVKFE